MDIKWKKKKCVSLGNKIPKSQRFKRKYQNNRPEQTQQKKTALQRSSVLKGKAIPWQTPQRAICYEVWL